MDELIVSIVNDLQKVHGIVEIRFLRSEDRELVANMEETSNTGFREVLKRSFVLVVTHDEKFHDPHVPIVQDGPANIMIFPAVDFPEIPSVHAISSSPGVKVHQYLVENYSLSMEHNEATLLVGFNL